MAGRQGRSEGIFVRPGLELEKVVSADRMDQFRIAGLEYLKGIEAKGAYMATCLFPRTCADPSSAWERGREWDLAMNPFGTRHRATWTDAIRTCAESHRGSWQ